MPSYSEWNRALHAYFLRGVSVGSTVYLEVSDETLDRIGRRFFADQTVDSWTEDFLASVRSRVKRGGSLDLSSFKKFDGTQLDSLPFLATLVLVASRMDSSGEFHESNYFSRLNKALSTTRTSAQNARPQGMESGSTAEEPLWLEWGRMLRRRGFMPTASPGEGARRYIGYALSQALFRKADKRRLVEIFEQYNWPRDLDGETLASLLRSASGLTTHIGNLLSRVGSDAEAVEGALQEIYGEWQDSRSGATIAGPRRASRTSIHCGLYRTLHFRTGEPRYRLLPIRPWRAASNLLVQLGDGEVELAEQSGHFAPLPVELGPETLEAGAAFQLSGSSDFTTLIFPNRKLWVLKPDPFDNAAFGTFGKAGVGEHFVLLAHKSMEADIEKANEQGLLKYGEKATTDAFGENWLEYEEVLVTAHQLSEATDISAELRDAIAPVSTFTLATSGGLAVPSKRAWLASSPPLVGVNSYFSEVGFSVTKDSELIQQGTVISDPSRELHLDIDWKGVGGYEITAEARGRTQRVLVNLIDWSDLPAPDPAHLGLQQLRISNTLNLVGPQVVQVTQ